MAAYLADSMNTLASLNGFQNLRFLHISRQSLVSIGVGFGVLFPSRPTTLDCESAGRSYHSSKEHSHVFKICGFVFFLMMPIDGEDVS